jgi:hypothetical protein
METKHQRHIHAPTQLLFTYSLESALKMLNHTWFINNWFIGGEIYCCCLRPDELCGLDDGRPGTRATFGLTGAANGIP